MRRSSYVLSAMIIAVMLAAPFIADAAYRSRATRQRETTNNYEAYENAGTGASGEAVQYRAQSGQDGEVVQENPLVEGRKLMADPNAIEAKIKQYPDLEPVLAQLSLRSRTEVNQWLRAGSGDERIVLIKALHNQTASEMATMRKLAEAEGAKKTAAAIDALMLERQSRYELLVRRIMEQKQQSSATTSREGSTRNSRTGTRSGRSSGRTGYQSTRRR